MSNFLKWWLMRPRTVTLIRLMSLVDSFYVRFCDCLILEIHLFSAQQRASRSFGDDPDIRPCSTKHKLCRCFENLLEAWRALVFDLEAMDMDVWNGHISMVLERDWATSRLGWEWNYIPTEYGFNENLTVSAVCRWNENERWWKNGETGNFNVSLSWLFRSCSWTSSSITRLMLWVCFEGGVLLLERPLRGEWRNSAGVTLDIC
jgi:hypothetical protein